MKRIYITFVLLLLLMSASAESVFEVGGIRYRTLTSNTVEVTSEGIIPHDVYSGMISIPSTVEFSDVTYTVTSIGDQVLRNCSELTEIHCQMEVPPAILRTVFTSVDTIACKLYVPISSSSLYSQAVGWGALTNIIEEAVTDVKEVNATPVFVYADQHEMVIKDAPAGEMIRVYALTGKLVKTIKATNEIRMQLPLNQVYLVNVADQTFKVAL